MQEPSPGETSPQALKEIGTDYLVIGHQNVDYFHETDEDINKKSAKGIFSQTVALPIICCGESLGNLRAGKAAEFGGAQVSAALAGLTAEQLLQQLSPTSQF